MKKSYRKFGNKKFSHDANMSWANKKNAEKQADSYRKKGCQARIVDHPKMNRYDVWVRCERGKKQDAMGKWLEKWDVPQE